MLQEALLLHRERLMFSTKSLAGRIARVEQESPTQVHTRERVRINGAFDAALQAASEHSDFYDAVQAAQVPIKEVLEERRKGLVQKRTLVVLNGVWSFPLKPTRLLVSSAKRK